jgi:hypothetical protein
MAAPEESVTVPRSVPRPVVWAFAATAASNIAAQSANVMPVRDPERLPDFLLVERNGNIFSASSQHQRLHMLLFVSANSGFHNRDTRYASA